jgi:hypothetical protein
VTLHPVHDNVQRERLTFASWHALDRKIAVARIKDEIMPKVRAAEWIDRALGLCGWLLALALLWWGVL